MTPGRLRCFGIEHLPRIEPSSYGQKGLRDSLHLTNNLTYA